MINLLIAGDYSPKNRVIAEIERNNAGIIFEEIAELTSQVDYSIVNFESAVADGTDYPIEKAGINLCCTAPAVKALRNAGFDMVTLANNHFYDFGESSIVKSLEVFETCGLDYVGAGINIEEAAKTFYKEIKDKKIAFISCCEHEFTIATKEHGGSNPLNPIQQFYAIRDAKENADFVIVIVHGGHEHFQLPSPRMKELYRFFIDSGADAVVNHHQHCFSGYEYYKNRPIFYGLGNFCFDEPNHFSKHWNEGVVLQLTLCDDKISHILYPIIQCKEDPTIKLIHDQANFKTRIAELNQIISDDELLENKIKEFYNSSGKFALSIFVPYTNRYFYSAWVHGLLPSFMNRSKMLRAYNHLFCESHLDRLKTCVNNCLNNNK